MTKFYMQFDDAKGDVTEKNHTNWIDLLSVEFSTNRKVSQESGNPKRNIGTPSISKIVVTKKMDSSTPQLFADSLFGKGAKCVLHYLDNSSQVFMEYTLENALLSHYSVHSSSGIIQPIEIAEISFTTMKTVYTPYDAPGRKGTPMASGYNIVEAKRI